MTFEEFKNEVLDAAKDRPSYIRLGQFVFNYVDRVYSVARYVQFIDGVDCFYDDRQIDSFLMHSYKMMKQFQKININ